MRNVRRMLVAILITLAGASVAFVPPAAADDAGDEAAFLSSLNGVRSAQGLRPLNSNAALTSVARIWAAGMAAAGSISHNPSLAAQGPSNWQRLGENVGMGMDVPRVHDAFVASPTHYRNMVDPGFDAVGIGVVRNGTGALFVTVNFMQSAAVVAAAAPAPAAPAPAPAAPAPAPAAAPVAAKAPAARPAPRAATPAPAPAPVAPVAPAAPVAEPAPVAQPTPVAEPAPVAQPVAAEAAPAAPAVRTQPASAPSDSSDPGHASVALALVCAGVVLAGLAGAVVFRRPEQRSAALARR